MSRKIQDLTINGLASGNRFLRVDANRMVEVSASSTINLATETTGTLSVANGGTGNTTFTDGGIVLGNGAAALAVTSPLTNGQIIVGSTGADPVPATLGAGNGIETTVGAGSISIAADIKTNGGLVFETGEIAVDLSATNITGILAPADGGLGVDASAATGALSFAAGSATIGTLSVGNGGTGLASVSTDVLLKGNGTSPLVETGITVDSSNNVSGINDMTITGDLVVQGTTTSIESVNVNLDDNHLFLNNGYTTTVAQTGGIVVNYLPTATNDTVAGAAFSSTTTVETTGAATFSAGDLVLITNANDTSNNGLFEVQSHASNVLTLEPAGEDYVQTSFVTDAVVAGTITQINVGVLRFGTSGALEVASGSSAPLAFNSVSTTGATSSFAGKTWYTNTATTTDATVTTITSIPTSSNSTIVLEFFVAGYNTTDSTSAGFRYDRTYRNTAGVLTQITGDSDLDFVESNPDFDLTVVASGSDILIRVTGNVGKTINWKSSGSVLVV